MKKPSCRFIFEKHVVSAFLIVALLLILKNQEVTADNANNNNKQVPAFFLKIAKTIPRIGRRSQPNYVGENANIAEEVPWHDTNDQVSDVSKRKDGFSPDSDTWNWQHFPLAVEGPPELWRSLAGYSRDPLYGVSNENFNNELWLQD